MAWLINGMAAPLHLALEELEGKVELESSNNYSTGMKADLEKMNKKIER